MDITNLSDMQISLIIIGIIIIIGVAIFNWVQQTRYQNKVKAAFDQKHEDVLLEPDEPLNPNERIEPQLNKEVLSEFQTNAAEPITAPEVNNDVKIPIPATSNSAIVEYDSTANYVITIDADSTIPSTTLATLLQRKFDFDKPVYWLGKHQNGTSWEEINTEDNTDRNDFVSLKGCLQLADRSGPISEVNLSKFRDMAQEFASQISANADCPDIVSAHDQAALLDKFCAEVDIMIGITIISKDDGAFVGTKIRALAEASGFKLDSEGLFRYQDEEEHLLFTLSNHESAPFLTDSMKTLTTHGITFLLDIPRVANGEKVFDQLIHLAKIFSNTLGGILVDDNRVPLSDSGIIKSKQLLNNIQAVMLQHKIPAGSGNALRLFI